MDQRRTASSTTEQVRFTKLNRFPFTKSRLLGKLFVIHICSIRSGIPSTYLHHFIPGELRKNFQIAGFSIRRKDKLCLHGYSFKVND